MFSSEIIKKTQLAPKQPGCYIYRDSSGNVLYVGKAKNLLKRVNQYFHNYEKLDPKIQHMVKQIYDIEYHTVDTELEALVLESTLIKKYSPKYNSMMKDDKKYVWVMIDNKEDFPRIRLVREKKKKNADYFGPFPSSWLVRNLLKKLRRIFPYRDCSRSIKVVNKQVKSSDTKPCLYYHIGLCEAPCTGKLTKLEYRKNINKIKQIFRGEIKTTLKDLKKQMYKESEKKNYEKAAKLRDQINEFTYVAQRIFVDFGMDEVELHKAKENRRNSAQKNLIENLNISQLKESGIFKIECYDISNFQGTNAVGSMVVFVDGKPKKSFYRKFKIKTKDTPDDFAMMQEVLERRLNRIGSDDKSFGQKPNLIIVDGGKGQLSSAYDVIESSEYNIPVVGLAKREEEIFKVIMDDNNKKEFERIFLSRKSPELYLVQRIRDEAHRFAITYHRNIRSKKQVITTLDNIPGVGKVTKKKLLQSFGSWDGVRKARISQLEKVVRNRKTLEAILREKERY